LIIALSNGGCHFVGNSACNNHHVCLSRGCAKDNAKSVLVIARH
jgi:hypothetical protein